MEVIFELDLAREKICEMAVGQWRGAFGIGGNGYPGPSPRYSRWTGRSIAWGQRNSKREVRQGEACRRLWASGCHFCPEFM